MISVEETIEVKHVFYGAPIIIFCFSNNVSVIIKHVLEVTIVKHFSVDFLNKFF